MSWTPLPDEVELTFTTPKPKAMMLNAAKTALVIVDMQKRFCSTPGTRAAEVVEGNLRLLTKAREGGVKVIFIQSVRKPDALEVTAFGREPFLLEGSEETEIVPELTPLADEIVVRKWSHDPFARTRLEEVLLEQQILPTDTTVIVTGVSAAVCANAACLGFANKNYMTVIPMDCQAASTIEDEAVIFGKYTKNLYAFTLGGMVEFSPVGMTTRELVGALA